MHAVAPYSDLKLAGPHANCLLRAYYAMYMYMYTCVCAEKPMPTSDSKIIGIFLSTRCCLVTRAYVPTCTYSNDYLPNPWIQM